jgi:hypothetical protein
MNKYHRNKQDALLQLLPDSSKMRATKIASYAFTSDDPLLALPVAKTWLNDVHYSWIEPYFLQLPPILHLPLLASLSKGQAEPLAKRGIAQLPEHTAPYSQSILSYAIVYLYNKWPDKEILPKALLGEHALTPLLQHSKSTLVLLIDLLAMHDLSVEVRKIVDKNLMQAIIQPLSLLQRKYLSNCLHQKSQTAVMPLNVKETHKNSKEFITTLHRSGIKRLSIALAGLPYDFMWHVAHILDRGRGKILMQQWQKEEAPTSTQVGRLQITQALQFIKINSTGTA